MKFITLNLGEVVGGKHVYHGTLVYTNSEGVKYFAAAGPSANLTATERRDPVNAFLAEAFKNSPLGTPYGKLVAYAGEVNSPTHAGIVDAWITRAVAKDLLNVGPNLLSQYVTIVEVGVDLNIKNVDYAPISQNSNGYWCTAAVVSGAMPLADLPANAYMGSAYYTPGCTILPSLYFGPSLLSSTSTTDVDGDSIVKITNFDPYGNEVSIINLASNHQDAIHEINDGIIQHHAMGYGLTIFGDNNYIRLASGDAQIYGNNSLVYIGNNTDVSVTGNVNDVVTSDGGSVAFEGDGNWIKLVSNIDMFGNGHYNDVGVKTNSNVVEMNGQTWNVPSTSRADDIWGNSVSGADMVLSAPNSDWWKYPESPIQTVNRGVANDTESGVRPLTPREVALSLGIIPFSNAGSDSPRAEPKAEGDSPDTAEFAVILVGWPQSEIHDASW